MVQRGAGFVAAVAVVLCFAAGVAAAADPESAGARYAADVQGAMAPLMRTYGPDAVNLEGNLLRYSVDHGSLLEASVGVSGPEQRGQSSYLVISLETGMVFKPSEVPPSARPARVWAEVIEPSLRKCRRLEVPADGIEIRTSYAHSDFTDRADLARRAKEGTVVKEAATFRFKATYATQLAAESISADDFLQRAEVEVDGTPIRLTLPSADQQRD